MEGMTWNPFTVRNAAAGLPGNGGQFAPTNRPESEVKLAGISDSPELSALRDAIVAADKIKVAAEHQMSNASAAAIDKMITEYYPTAATAIFNRSYDQDSFVLEELRDKDDELVPFGNHPDDASYQINVIAENIGHYGDYLGDDVETIDGESVGFTVGSIAARNSADDASGPRVLAIHVSEPDVSSLSLYQASLLQSALIGKTGLVGPIIDATEARYQLFDGLDDPAYASRVTALEEALGGKDQLALAVTGTESWNALEDVMIDAIANKNTGTTSAVRKAIVELEELQAEALAQN
jgi:hypothetical protein